MLSPATHRSRECTEEMLEEADFRRLDHDGRWLERPRRRHSYRTRGPRRPPLKRYRSGGEQRMVVQHVNVAEGGQAIVGNVSTPAPGVRATEKAKEQPLALAYAPGVEMPRPIEAERAPMPRAGGSGV